MKSKLRNLSVFPVLLFAVCGAVSAQTSPNSGWLYGYENKTPYGQGQIIGYLECAEDTDGTPIVDKQLIRYATDFDTEQDLLDWYKGRRAGCSDAKNDSALARQPQP